MWGVDGGAEGRARPPQQWEGTLLGVVGVALALSGMHVVVPSTGVGQKGKGGRLMPEGV